MMTLYFATIAFYTLEKFLTFFAWKKYDEHHPENRKHSNRKHPNRKKSFADQHKDHSVTMSAWTLGSLSTMTHGPFVYKAVTVLIWESN